MPQDLGAPNVVTGILITFRGFDTLGEVAVLFMVAASVGLLLASKPDAETKPKTAAATAPPRANWCENGAEVILPLIFLFGAYVIMNGHLSAGGGFQGGAVVASGVMLLLLAKPASRLASRLSRASRNRSPACSTSRSAFCGLDLRRRLPRQPHPAERRIRHAVQRRRNPADFSPARHQGRC